VRSLFEELRDAVGKVILDREQRGKSDGVNSVVAMLFVFCRLMNERISIRIAAASLVQWSHGDPELAKAAVDDAYERLRRAGVLER